MNNFLKTLNYNHHFIENNLKAYIGDIKYCAEGNDETKMLFF